MSWWQAAANAAGRYGPRMAGYLQNAANLTQKVISTPQGRGLVGSGVGYVTADPGQRMQGAVRGGLFAIPLGANIPGQRFAATQIGRIPGVSANVATNLAQVGVPLAALGVVSGQGTGGPQAVQQGVTQAGGNVRDIAAGQILYNAQGEPVSSYGPPVTPGYGGFGPPGNVPFGHNIWDVASPTGPISSNLLLSNRQAQTMADNINVLAPTQMKYAEERSRRELDRQLTAAQVRKNIDLAAQMTANQQVNALNMGRDTLGGVISAINANPRYY